MADTRWQIRIPADDDGYVPLRCPYCASDFKLLASDLRQCDGPDLFCASCGLAHEVAQFLLRPDVREVVQRQAQNLITDLLNEFAAGLVRDTRGSQFLKVTADTVPTQPVPKLRAITDLVETELPCCDTTVKLTLDQAASVFYCPFCGHTQS